MFEKANHMKLCEIEKNPCFVGILFVVAENIHTVSVRVLFGNSNLALRTLDFENPSLTFHGGVGE